MTLALTLGWSVKCPLPLPAFANALVAVSICAKCWRRKRAGRIKKRAVPHRRISERNAHQPARVPALPSSSLACRRRKVGLVTNATTAASIVASSLMWKWVRKEWDVGDRWSSAFRACV